MLESVQKIDLDALERTAIEKASQEYIDLQKDQLADGLRSDDKPIFNLRTGSDEYSPDYALYKGFKKPINLHDTGEFYNAIFTKMGKDGLIIDSNDSKANMLQQRYGDEIFGLNKTRRPEFIEAVQKNFITDLRKAI